MVFYDRGLRLTLFLVVLLVVPACRDADRAGVSDDSRSGRSSAPEPAKVRPRVVVLGDSLTAGLGLPSDEAFPARLQQRLDAAKLEYDVVNAGVSGDTSAGGLRRLNWVLTGDVRVLVVALGANDGLRGLPTDQLKRNLETIVATSRNRGISVLLAGMEAPPNFGAEYTAAFRQVYRDVAQKHRVPLIPFLLEGVAGEAHLNQPDGIHPNADGARHVADHVWRALQPMLVRT